ncbi:MULTISPECIES: hypothetical protein [unclassified Sphingopyxis]|jgi:hypothetical protein|uniref:hypothetical protein n=1 Tax=unclassified Sphingopyxis TaxID=2614943 RepID=UPI0024ADB80A|nr:MULTISPECIES: hypothetical protein [unclassified Sphingopyxis]
MGAQDKFSVLPCWGLHAVIGLALVFQPLSARAQEIPIVQSGAEGRFERQIDGKVSIAGVDRAMLARFRGAIDRLIAQLAAMPSVSAPPAPVCHRLMSFVEVTRPHGVLSGSVSVLSPISFAAGRCHRMTGGGVEVIMNRMDAAFETSRAHMSDVENGRANWFIMGPEVSGNIVRLPNGTIVITNGKPILTPVSARRYRAEHEKRFGPMKGVLTEQTAGKQACLDESIWSIDPAADCPPARRIWEANPDYFDAARVGDVQLLVLRTPQGPYHGESEARYQARKTIWASIDLDGLAEQVR